MLKSLRKQDKILSIINGSLVDLPSPSSLTYFWNFGSLLGIFLMFQILTGLFLAMQFSGSVILSFDSLIHMMRDVNYGWMMRIFHANGASFFFLFMYMHMGRGLYYGSYRFTKTWLSGVTILLLSMATAFLGYVLPWGQMSFWAATVIANLLSAIPYVGVMLVEWVWGGFSVGNSTLTRFFAFHFILPFIILFLVIFHLLFLHETGSSNPLGVDSMYDKIYFHPYFSLKDIYGLMMMLMLYLFICFEIPYIFMDVENFIPSNPMVTPVHIQPEWYFLFAYTILRSISSSIGGVVALMMSVLILYFLPMFLNHSIRSTMFYPMMKVLFWYFVVNWMLLTWIGACEVDYPFMQLGIVFSFLYFFMYMNLWMLSEIQDMMN
uniref:Cytochrome b n=1 Tax=Cyrtarachne nagasakiensis TaxID=386110 RepID=A0A0U2HKN5_9ARAC|nr:cytochrome b [Cyrtarachne nagasakiensis]ALF36385.1 cytochrome b [Cyrtarachne nagasakiensis]